MAEYKCKATLDFEFTINSDKESGPEVINEIFMKIQNDKDKHLNFFKSQIAHNITAAQLNVYDVVEN